MRKEPIRHYTALLNTSGRLCVKTMGPGNNKKSIKDFKMSKGIKGKIHSVEVDSTIVEGARKEVDVPPRSQRMERGQETEKNARIVDNVDSGKGARNFL